MSADTLATVAADPDRIASVPPEHIPALIGAAETLRALLWARLQTAVLPSPPAIRTAAKAQPDRLLNVGEAAERLGVTSRWIYRKADVLPFTRRLGSGTLRFSERGLERWKESRP